MRTLLDGRVAWVLEYGQDIEEMMKMGEEFDRDGRDSSLEAAREHLCAGVAVQGATP